MSVDADLAKLMRSALPRWCLARFNMRQARRWFCSLHLRASLMASLIATEGLLASMPAYFGW